MLSHRCTHTHNQAYVHTAMRIYIHTHIHSYMHPYMHSNIHSNINTLIYLYVLSFMHTYIHGCFHAYMHSYIQRCKSFGKCQTFGTARIDFGQFPAWRRFVWIFSDTETCCLGSLPIYDGMGMYYPERSFNRKFQTFFNTCLRRICKIQW